jgi:hypothetical protein
MGMGVPCMSAARGPQQLSPFGAPKGVDLNLNEFDLSGIRDIDRGEASEPLGDDLDGCLTVGEAFWKELEGEHSESTIFGKEKRTLLREVLSPALCDRRAEGDLFVPPDFGGKYMRNLESLVREERRLRQSRREHFCSPDFVPTDAGPLFPASWIVSSADVSSKVDDAAGPLRARPDFQAQAGLLGMALECTAPSFDKHVEDGERFRIYRLGGLEVRTVQEQSGSEEIVAVFSREAEAKPCAASLDGAPQDERVTKVVQLVERDPHALPGTAQPWRYYVVLTTDTGRKIVTEKQADGTVAWEDMTNSDSALEARNSLAKVLRSDLVYSNDLHKVTLQQLSAFASLRGAGPSAAPSSLATRRRYSDSLYDKAVRS